MIVVIVVMIIIIIELDPGRVEGELRDPPHRNLDLVALKVLEKQ